MPILDRVKVYGLSDSIKASKYPMSVDLEKLNDDVTDGVRKRGACPPGTGHDQFLTGIIVQFDLTFSIKAWVEAERYHFFDFVSSQSTMHRIMKFDLTKQMNEYVSPALVKNANALVSAYKADPSPENYLRAIYNIPVGMRLTARMTTNYRQLKTIYQQRKDHRLPEWREFCRELETLPMWKELTQGEPETSEQGATAQGSAGR